MPRSIRNILLAVAGLCLVYRFVSEGALAYMIADWRRIMFIVAVALLGALVVAIARSQAPFMQRTIHNPMMFLGFGMAVGCMIGVLEITIVSVLWHLHGEPDGYFRSDWDGVIIGCILYAASGAAAGIGFAGMLFFIESRFQRAIRFGRLASFMLLISVSVFGLAYFGMFHWGWAEPFVIGDGIVFAACTGAALLITRGRDHQPPPLPREILASGAAGNPSSS